MKNPIRWGILGTGFIAHLFAEGLRFVPDSTITAVASRTQSKADEFSGRFGGMRAYGNYHELAADKDVDVIYVSTPANLHQAHCVLCLDNGKGVLCEKPFATNAQEAQDIITAARTNNCFCMEAMWMRFIPLMVSMRAMIQQGAIGDIRMVMVDMGSPNFYDPNNRHFNPSLGGGAMLDLGIYGLSFASWLLGRPSSVVSCATMTPSGVDEHSSAILSYPNGEQAIITANIRCQSSNEAFIVGSEGHIRIHAPLYRPHKLSLSHVAKPVDKPRQSYNPGVLSRAKKLPLLQGALLRLDGFVGPWLRPSGKTIVVPFQGNGYNHEAEAVVKCLRSGEKECSSVPLDESLNIMEVMDSIRNQWQEHPQNPGSRR